METVIIMPVAVVVEYGKDLLTLEMAD